MNFYGDHNLGLFCRASENICIVGNFIDERDAQRLEDMLKVKIIRTSVAQTDLVGMFSSFNSNGIVLPCIATQREVEEAKKIGLDMMILDSKFTAVGNLILCNDNGAVIGKILSSCKKAIEKCLGVDAVCSTVTGMNTVGSCGIATNTGCLLHRDAKPREIRTVEKALDVEAGVGTANFGSPFVGSCAVANSTAVAVGESTTGPEMNRFMEALKLF
jgi:translation initiation factor 6